MLNKFKIFSIAASLFIFIGFANKANAYIDFFSPHVANNFVKNNPQVCNQIKESGGRPILKRENFGRIFCKDTMENYLGIKPSYKFIRDNRDRAGDFVPSFGRGYQGCVNRYRNDVNTAKNLCPSAF